MLYLHAYKTILHTLHYMYISIDTKNVLTEVILHITIIIVRYNTTQKIVLFRQNKTIIIQFDDNIFIYGVSHAERKPKLRSFI